MSINNNFIERREARIIAFQSLFSYDFNPISTDELLLFSWLNSEEDKMRVDAVLTYASFLVKGTIDNLLLIDQTIKTKLRNWDFNRISAIDKSILRFSVFSLLFEEGLDDKVVINEAIEIVKQFGPLDSYKFINGLLDAVVDSKNSTIKKKKIVKQQKIDTTKKSLNTKTEEKKIRIIKKI